jgi:predicted alpha/beta superfamily hydrolase
VVYLLDGDSLFPMLAPHHLFLTYDENLPEAVIVGIAYGSLAPGVNRRDLDYVGPSAARPAAEAGAPAFQTFLKSELLPNIEARYRVDPARRVLVGQSLGANFVLYSAFAEPDLFWGRIASNPVFQLDRDRFFGPPPGAMRKDLSLIVVSGSRDRRRSQAVEWFEAWKDRATPWTLHPVTIEGGTHAADIPNAYRIGMLRLFHPKAP